MEIRGEESPILKRLFSVPCCNVTTWLDRTNGDECSWDLELFEFFFRQALFGFQLALTMIMASFLQKLGRYYSVGRWLLTSTGWVDALPIGNTRPKPSERAETQLRFSGYDNFKPLFKSSILKCISCFNGSCNRFFFLGGFSERKSQDLSNGSNVASYFANFFSVFTSLIC